MAEKFKLTKAHARAPYKAVDDMLKERGGFMNICTSIGDLDEHEQLDNYLEMDKIKEHFINRVAMKKKSMTTESIKEIIQEYDLSIAFMAEVHLPSSEGISDVEYFIAADMDILINDIFDFLKQK